MKTILRMRMLVIWSFYILIIWGGYSCSSSDDIYGWTKEDLAETVWDGEIQVNNEKEKIRISFDSNSNGYCYLDRVDVPSCLFEYSMSENRIIFYNIYGDDDKLIISGTWNFITSEKRNLKLERITSFDTSDYLILKKR